MAYTGEISGRQRTAAGGAAALIVFAVGLGLIAGLDLRIVRLSAASIAAIAIPAPPPERLETRPQRASSASGPAAAANRRARASPTLAVAPRLPSPAPPIAATSKPAAGVETTTGAAPIPGPGTGAAGRGDGTGAGGTGNGTGGGSKAVWQSGSIRDGDYPADASRAQVGGDVEVRFIILPTGRVTGCRVERSSGNATLDATTCRLIEERFRFRPATDGAGTAIASSYGWRQSWWLERRR